MSLRPEVADFELAMRVAEDQRIKAYTALRASFPPRVPKHDLAKLLRSDRVAIAKAYEAAVAAAGRAYCEAAGVPGVRVREPVGTLVKPPRRRKGFDARYDWGDSGED